MTVTGETAPGDDAPGPEWLWHVATGLVAGPLSVLGGGALALVAYGLLANTGWSRVEEPVSTAAMLGAAGAVAGLAWGGAEALAASRRLVRALLVLALGGALAALAASYTEVVARGKGSIGANDEFLKLGLSALAGDAVFGAGAALALGTPLLAVRSWALRSPAQGVAQGAALLAWLPGLFLWPWQQSGWRGWGEHGCPELVWRLLERTAGHWFTEGTAAALLALIFWCVQALVFPVTLDLVGPRVRRTLARLGLEDEEPAPRHPPARPRRAAAILFLLLLATETALGPAFSGTHALGERYQAYLQERDLREQLAARKTAAAVALADVLARRGDREALVILERAAAAGDGQAILRLAQGADWGHLGAIPVPRDPNAAFEGYCRAVARVPAYARSHRDWMAQNQPDLPAVRAWRRAETDRLTGLALTQGVAPLLELASLDAGVGDVAGAIEVLRAAAATGDPKGMVALADQLVRAGQVEEGLAWLERAAAVDLMGKSLARTTRRELVDRGFLPEGTAPEGTAPEGTAPVASPDAVEAAPPPGDR